MFSIEQRKDGPESGEKKQRKRTKKTKDKQREKGKMSQYDGVYTIKNTAKTYFFSWSEFPAFVFDSRDWSHVGPDAPRGERQAVK